MQNQLLLIPSNNVNRRSLFIIPISAALITFALFAMMQALIKNDQIPRVEPIPDPIITLFGDFEDKPITERPTLKPKPTPKELPKPPSKIIDNEPDPSLTPDPFSPIIPVPKFTNKINTNTMLSPGEARPIVRVNPKYPIKAAQNGIEGWVQLSFAVTTSGEVENVKVLNAEPRNIFDREARRALKKWKYKPNIVDGIARVQEGLVVVLEFKLDS